MEKATIKIGDDWQNGWLHFGLWLEAAEGRDIWFDSDSLKGRVRVVENPSPASEEFRVCVEWELLAQESFTFGGQPGRFITLGHQQNHLPYLPVIGKKQEKLARG